MALRGSQSDGSQGSPGAPVGAVTAGDGSAAGAPAAGAPPDGAAWRRWLEPCHACPVKCGAARLSGERGACGAAALVPISSAFPHFGEERPISGHRGSGTLFVGGCNLHCLYCQNSDISQLPPEGPAAGGAEELTPREVAALMLRLQAAGCHNVNLVSPTHVGPQLGEAIGLARAAGLRVPVVWNSGGYDHVPLLRELAGLVDVYMPDAKYGDAALGERLSGVPDYPEVMRAALTEMHRQVGDLVLDADGVATRGLLVRHLVLPNGLAGTEAVLRFLAESLSRDTYVNLMGQYHPCHRAGEDPRLGRRPTVPEMEDAYAMAARLGLHRLDERPHRRWWG